MLFFAQIDQNLLSVTGVIATILSVIFAIAAFYNSRTRKKHIQELERAQKQGHAIHFRPSKSSHSGLSSRTQRLSQSSGPAQEDRPQPAPRAAPVAQSAPPAPAKRAAETQKSDVEASETETKSLFRKVGPSGIGSIESNDEADEQDDYIWE